MARSVEGRISAMWNTVPDHAGMCAAIVWQSLSVPRLGAATATIAGNIVAAAGHMRSGSPSSVPRGGIMFWSGGSHGAGHMAISLGGGNVLSTDVLGPATVGSVSASWFASHWGALNWRGWSSWYSVELPMAAGAPGSIPVDGGGNEIAGTAPADSAVARITATSVEWFHIAGWQPQGGGSGFVTDHDVPMMWLQDEFKICYFHDTDHGRANPVIQTFTPASDILVCRIAPSRNRYRAPSLWWFVKEKVNGTHFNLGVYQAKWKKDTSTKHVGFDRNWRTKANRLGTLKGLTMTTGSKGTVFVDRRRNDAYEVILSGIWAKIDGTQGASFVLTEGGFRIVGAVPVEPAIAMPPSSAGVAGHMVGAGGGGSLPSKPGVQPRDWDVKYASDATAPPYDSGNLYTITVLGALPSGHTLLVYGYSTSYPYTYGYFEVENLASQMLEPSAEADHLGSSVSPLVRVVRELEEYEYPASLKQSADGEICWFTRAGYYGTYYLNVYDPSTGDYVTFDIGHASFYVGSARIASTGGYVHAVFTDSLNYDQYVVCFSLKTGAQIWEHLLHEHTITTDINGDPLGAWDYSNDGWRKDYQFIAAVDRDRYIVQNASPDTVSVSAQVTLQGATYLANGTLASWNGWYGTSATWNVYLNEAGETRIKTTFDSGCGCYFASVAGRHTLPGGGWWWDNPTVPTGYYSCGGYTSTEMHYAGSDNYYDIWNTTGFQAFVSVDDANHTATGNFTMTGTTDGWIGQIGSDGFGLGITKLPYLYYSVEWDNTRFNGNRLELRGAGGAILDTLPFTNGEEASFIAYDNNKIFVGAALKNPWTEDAPTNQFFSRKITVSGNSMSYSPICSYTLPAHFNWDNTSTYWDDYDPVRGVTLGVWKGQVVVHALNVSVSPT